MPHTFPLTWRGLTPKVRQGLAGAINQPCGLWLIPNTECMPEAIADLVHSLTVSQLSTSSTVAAHQLDHRDTSYPA